MTDQLPWIQEKSASSLRPAQVERTLRQLCDVWPHGQADLRETIEKFPLGESALLHLIAVSTICAARLASDPQIFVWLSHPDVCNDARGHGRMLADLHRAVGSEPLHTQNFRALRLWKGREMLRIALREVADAAPLEETTAELSQLAEICVTQVLEHWDAELRKRLGGPGADFAVLALGKLGGQELNHSSDIDVMFIYSEEGNVSPNLTNHEWFNRLGTKVFETFSRLRSIGLAFPDGSATPPGRERRPGDPLAC